MPGFSTSQKARLAAAQKTLDTAKAVYNGHVSGYNNYGAGITPCFHKKAKWYDASQAATWFNPSRKDCVGSSPIKTQGCSNSDKNQCQAFVDTLNKTKIPALRAAKAVLNTQQANYNKVLAEVTAEVNADPQTQIDVAAAAAAAAAGAQADKLKWAFAINSFHQVSLSTS